VTINAFLRTLAAAYKTTQNYNQDATVHNFTAMRTSILNHSLTVLMLEFEIPTVENFFTF
jgi:hypothetical protein